MPLITISGNDFSVYATVEDADEYLAGDFDATKWRAETDADAKGRAIVTGTRVLDRMAWLGDKSDPDQVNAFPRDNMGLSDVEDGETPQAIIDASIVLAKLIHAGSKVDNTASTDPGIKREKAGSVEIEFFIATGDPSRFPVSVQELIARFLAGASWVGGSIASGVGGCSDFSPTHPATGPL